MRTIRIALATGLIAAASIAVAAPAGAADDGYFYQWDVTSVECDELINGNVFMSVNALVTANVPAGSTTAAALGIATSSTDHDTDYVVTDVPDGIGANQGAPPPISTPLRVTLTLADGFLTYEEIWTIECDAFGDGTFELVSQDFFPEPDPPVTPPVAAGDDELPAAVAASPRFTG